MNKKILFGFAFLSISVMGTDLSAQTAQGSISPEMLQEIEASYRNTPTEKALRNAIINNNMSSLVLDANKFSGIDQDFTYRVSTKGISNQLSSGRCWLFTGLNVLRSRMITNYGLGAFFFSHNYNFFWDQMEKANLFLQGIIDTRQKPMDDKMVEWLFKNPIGDGGQFTGVSDNLYKYGLVPADVMPETYSSNNTGQMNKILSRLLRQAGIRMRAAAEKGVSEKELMQQKTACLKDVYRVLVMNLGIPPKTFTYSLRDAKGNIVSTETYTPQSFYNKFIGRDMRNEYVMLMNDPSRPYNKLYEIDYDRHSYDGKNWTYVNLPMEEIKQMAIASLKDSTMMYYSCDVGKELDRKKGYLDLENFDYNSLLGIDLNMNKKERIATFDSGSTHAMTLVAVDLDQKGKPTKWMVENSWGETNGFNGHLIMTDRWFDAYTFRLVIDKRYVTPKVKALLKTEPVRLPAWDPMFSAEN